MDISILVMMNVVTELGLGCFYEKILFESWVSKFFLSISKNLVEEKKLKKKIFCEHFSQFKKNFENFFSSFKIG
jgi:hypothetical protein